MKHEAKSIQRKIAQNHANECRRKIEAAEKNDWLSEQERKQRIASY